MRALTIACVVLATLSAGKAVAEEPHPDSGAAPMRLLRPDYRTLLGITLGQSSFEEVQREFGPSRVIDHGDGCDRTELLCYTSSRKGDSTTLLFSRSKMSDLSGILLLHKRPAKLTDVDCTATPRVHRKLATASGLRLGLSAARVRQVLPLTVEELRDATVPHASLEPGTAIPSDGTFRCVNYYGNPRSRGPGDECITSGLSFEAGRLTGLSVDYLITY